MRLRYVLISISQFNIPNLRVGTLDSLLALGDDLLKVIRVIVECDFAFWFWFYLS